MPDAQSIFIFIIERVGKMTEAIIKLYYEEYLTAHEISVVLQIPIQWVKEALNKAGTIMDTYLRRYKNDRNASLCQT